METVRLLPPTQKEIASARQELYKKLALSEKQPLSEKRGAEVVFAEKREKLERLLHDRI